MDPLLIDVPEQIESNRLIIRAPRPGDGAEINAAIVESIAELRQWMPWAKQTPTVDETESNNRRAAAKFAAREDLRLQFYLKDSGIFVGSSGLHRIDWSVPKFEIGYWVRTSLGGRGYATEATEAITKLAFEQLAAKRIEIRMDEKNLPSRKIPERLGFSLEGVLRNYERDHYDVVRDTRIYAKVCP
jgi:RimJ/RimL family protein N-acetyltransferase